MDSLVGLDLGTTAIKAAVYALDGRRLGSAAQEYDLITPRSGWVEQDPCAWWDRSVQTLRQALAQASSEAHQPAAISISSQGISFVPIDASGAALGNALCWLDMRAEVEAETVRQCIADERLFELTGKRPSAAYILPKLLWMRRHEPDRFDRAVCFQTAHDFLLYRLCGASVTDYSLASGSLLFDLNRLEWNRELLEAFDLDVNLLPAPVCAGTPAGELGPSVALELGLPVGLPVVVGGQDQKVAALGAGLSPGLAAVSLGTAAAVSRLSERPVLDPLRRIPLFPFVAPGLWDLEGVIGTAGAALRWARDTLFPALSYEQMDALARQSPPGANGLRFYPHLAGATSPHWRPAATGSLSGLSLASSSADLLRSLYEGVAFQIRANLDVMAQLAPPQALILFGGGSRSLLWGEIIAAVANLPVACSSVPDVALWGACRLAGFGAGLFADRFDHAAPLDFHPPPPAWVECYANLYRDYCAAE